MRLLVVMLLLSAGCAQRYLRVTASSAINCDDITVTEQRDGWVVKGCGRMTVCNRLWQSGTFDEWDCQNIRDPALYEWRR